MGNPDTLGKPDGDSNPLVRSALPANASAQSSDLPPVEKIVVRNLDFYYSKSRALYAINLTVYDKCVTALIGPSGCGKSTLLRVFNRLHDLYPDQRCTGEILLDGRNLLDEDIDVRALRARVGMVFQKPTPFPMSICENIAFGVRLHERLHPHAMDARVEETLHRAALWDETKDILHHSGLSLSGGQQQRLCIARAIAVNPEIVLLDEPCSALDPISTAHIEQLISELKSRFCVVIITHNMQQAARLSDFTGFMYLGEMIEFDRTEALFTRPRNHQTEAYVTGRFG